MPKEKISETAKLVAIMIAAATVIGITGCSGGSDTPGTAGSGSDTGGGTSGGEDEADTSGCLVGDWVATDAGLDDWYRSFVSGEDIVINSVNGEVLVSFSDTDFIFSTREIVVELTIAEQNATTLIAGGTAGTYRAEPGGIMSTTVDSNDLSGKVSVSGIEFTSEELGIDFSGAGAFVGYECTGGNLRLETQSAGGGTAAVELEPAR
mgnify:CR=1 FL=1